jgi:hypothetical protein
VSDLCVFSFLDGLLHRLQGVAGKLSRYDKLPVNVFDFFHHVRLELGEGFMEPMDALQHIGRSLDMDMCAGAALAAERLEDGVEQLDGGQLVVEDVCPRVSPLLCRFLELAGVSEAEDELRAAEGRVVRPLGGMACLATTPPVQAGDSWRRQATTGRTFSNMTLESSKSLSMASTSASLGVRVRKRPVNLCMRCILNEHEQLGAIQCEENIGGMQRCKSWAAGGWQTH